MNKLFLTLALLLTLSVSSFAEIFVNGTVGISTRGGKTEAGGATVDDPSVLGFSFVPRIGIKLNDKIALGGYFGVALSREKEIIANVTNKDKETVIPMGIFARLYMIEIERLSLFAEADLGFLIGRSKVEAAGASADGPKVFGIGFDVVPGLAYKFNNFLSLEAKFGILGLGFSHIKETTAAGGGADIVDKQNDFHFGVEAYNQNDHIMYTHGAFMALRPTVSFAFTLHFGAEGSSSSKPAKKKAPRRAKKVVEEEEEEEEEEEYEYE